MSQPPALQVEHDGRTWVLEYGEFTALDDRAIWRETGVTIAQILTGRRLSPFTIAALLWRHRVNNGEPGLTYEQVAETVTLTTLTTVGQAEGPGDGPRPSDGS